MLQVRQQLFQAVEAWTSASILHLELLPVMRLAGDPERSRAVGGRPYEARQSASIYSEVNTCSFSMSIQRRAGLG